MDGSALDEHYEVVISEIAEGGVVPMLGAGVNLCGRPEGVAWERDAKRLAMQAGDEEPKLFAPSGGELAGYLARRFKYPETSESDLLRISQWVIAGRGNGPLYRELREIFDVDYAPSALHVFLARLPAALTEKDALRRYQLILTTNYDDALEQAFRTEAEPFDLLSYIALGDDRGKFLHTSPDGSREVIHTPNDYRGLSLDERTVIVKIHGFVDRSPDRTGAEGDSYVITEDDYVDYLTRADIAALLPPQLQIALRESAFLFLGYSLRDWNMRVILQRIWGQQSREFPSWSIQKGPGAIEQKIWKKRTVDILDVDLAEYVAGLTAALARPLGEGVG